jgi:hypothetical protein
VPPAKKARIGCLGKAVMQFEGLGGAAAAAAVGIFQRSCEGDNRARALTWGPLPQAWVSSAIWLAAPLGKPASKLRRRLWILGELHAAARVCQADARRRVSTSSAL